MTGCARSPWWRTRRAAPPSGEEAVAVDGSHGVILNVTAERTGLGVGAIVGIVVLLAVVALAIAAGVLGYLYRGRIKSLLGGSSPEGPGAV